MSKRFLTATLFALAAGALVSAQNYKAPRTPWGDPDLSGVYSNDDETGTPIERPAVFDGRRQEDITPAELKQINQQRNEQFNAGVAGTEFAGGLRPPPHLIRNIRLDLGDARGRWEGDTLVVETTNFTERSAYRGASPDLKMTERFKPLSAGAVDWSVTFDDPRTWTRPWTFTMKLAKKDRTQQVFEYACHEGNYAMPNILSAQRSAEKAAAAATTP